MNPIITCVDQLDADNRETVCELILCDPYAGYLAREYLEVFPMHRGSSDEALCGLIGWLILAREACGVQGIGHA